MPLQRNASCRLLLLAARARAGSGCDSWGGVVCDYGIVEGKNKLFSRTNGVLVNELLSLLLSGVHVCW